jgi:hypothetical protein
MARRMPTYKIIALQSVEVTAHVWYRGTRKTTRDHQGAEMLPVAAIKNESQSFDLQKGQSRDDISFLETVNGAFFDNVYPEKVNADVNYKGLLRIVKISDDKPAL